MAKTTGADKGGVKKTVCAIGREQFTDNAKPMLIKGIYGDQEFSVVLGAKEFSTGSFGWTAGGEKAVIMIDGVACKIQLGINLTVVGSKDAK